MKRVKTTKHWQKHLPQKPKRVTRGYYEKNSQLVKKRIARVIWLIVIILLVQSIFQAKYLKIDKIELTNNQDITFEEIDEFLQAKLTVSRWLIFKNSNYFLFKDKEAAEELLVNYNLDQVKVDKKFPDKLIVTVKEKISHFIWVKDDSLYLLDASGALNRQIKARDDKYLIIEDSRAYTPSDDQKFSAEDMDIINQIYLSWHDTIGAKAKLVKIMIDDNWNLLELHTEIGYYVKLDSSQNIKQQINNLNQIISAGNIHGIDVDYIDLRFGDKVYFK